MTTVSVLRIPLVRSTLLVLTLAASFATLPAIAGATCIAPLCSGIGASALGLVEDSQNPYQAGCAFEYKADFTVALGNPGTLGPLVFPPCADGPCAGSQIGASAVICLIESGYGCVQRPDSSFSIQIGSMVGPLFQALNTRWAADSDQTTGICAEQYTGNGQRLLTVVITGPPPGDGTAPGLRYERIFLKAAPSHGSLVFEIAPEPPTPARTASWGSIKSLYR